MGRDGCVDGAADDSDGDPDGDPEGAVVGAAEAHTATENKLNRMTRTDFIAFPNLPAR
jgi:hypothetical protein